MSTEKLSVKYWVLVLALVLVLPLTILFVYQKQSNTKMSDAVIPKITDQPKETLVASGVLPLHQWKTQNDVPVYFVPTETLPILDIDVSFDAGSARDAQEQAGLAYLTMKILNQGTQNLQADPDAVALGFENVGAILDADIDKDKASIRLRSLSQIKQLNDTISLFADVIAEPVFSDESFARVKEKAKVQLSRGLQDPGFVASRAFYEQVYGEHPYAHAVLGTEETIEAITKEKIIDFHKKYYVASNAHITIVGGIHRNKAKEIAEVIAKQLEKGEKPQPIAKVKEIEEKLKAKEVKFPSQQSHVLMGQPGRIVGDDKLFPLLVGNHILGSGGFTSRLFKEVRKENGLAYSVYSYFYPLKELGPFMISLQTQGEQTGEALNIAKSTLVSFLQEGPSDEELMLAKQHLIGAFAHKFDSNRKLLNVVSDQAFYGLPSDFFDTYNEAIEKVTRDDIIESFKSRLDPEHMALVVVGEQTS